MVAREVEVGGFSFVALNEQEARRIGRTVFERGEYDVTIPELSALIIDAGAHIGVATARIASRHPGARILAFEPNPELFPLLLRNISANRLAGVEAFQIALGA